MSDRLDNYHAASAAYHQLHMPAEDEPDPMADAWDALTLTERLRVILAVPWRDAIGEIRHALGARRLPPEPPIGTVLETSDDLDTYRIERDGTGWHVRYWPVEPGQPLTGRGLSWEATWRSLGPPVGAKPFRAVLPGEPDLPPRPLVGDE